MTVTYEHLVTSINLRISEIDSEIYKSQKDLKASNLAGGGSCCSSCFQTGVIETLRREQESLKNIITGGLWCRTRLKEG